MTCANLSTDAASALSSTTALLPVADRLTRSHAHDMHPQIAQLLDDQCGVISRRQLEAAGLAAHDIARLVRRRLLTRLHAGVFVDHTGKPTWMQRAWGAVLLYEPAALYGASALRAVEQPTDASDEVIHIAIDRRRRVAERAGVRIHRVAHIGERVQWHARPPRQRYEDAVLDAAASGPADADLPVVAALTRAVQSRRTTAVRLLEQLDRRPRLPRRAWIRTVLIDIAAGSCSALEHAYLQLERRHGVHGARRQVVDRVGAQTVYRDVEYACGQVVELDGRLVHDTAWQRDRDLDRDLALRVDGRDSIRLSWGQVFDRGCLTMSRIVALLEARGWPSTAYPCGPGCPVRDSRTIGPTRRQWSA